jgi:simple sugar transport system ATP-binding protein
VHSAFGAALSRGAGVLLISTDLDEILARADRLAVLYRGRLSRVFGRPFPTAEIGGLMAGSEAA